MTIEETRSEYENVLNKEVPTSMKNNEEWMLKKIEEFKKEAQARIEPENKNETVDVVEAEIVRKVPSNMGRGVKKGETVEIYTPKGKLLRTYSKEVHGEKYLENAKSFCSKRDDYEKFAF